MKYNSIIFYVSYVDFECYENDIKNDKFILWDKKNNVIYKCIKICICEGDFLLNLNLE